MDAKLRSVAHTTISGGCGGLEQQHNLMIGIRFRMRFFHVQRFWGGSRFNFPPPFVDINRVIVGTTRIILPPNLLRQVRLGNEIFAHSSKFEPSAQL